MKKINEQTKSYPPVASKQQKQSPNPVASVNKSSYVNKTVNLYKDKNETQLIRQVKIKDVTPKGKFIEISTNMVIPYTYDCGELYLKPSAGEFYLLYNKKLTDKLKTDFCTKSSGGANVPKADFASNGQPAQGQTMAEGKKVVRITEKGLARLVNKVLNEQAVAPKTDYKVDPNWLKPNGWRVVKEDGKVVLPNLVVNGIVGCVYADDYEYILTGNGRDTYACDSMGQCYSCTDSVVSKTSDVKKAKANVNLP